MMQQIMKIIIPNYFGFRAQKLCFTHQIHNEEANRGNNYTEINRITSGFVIKNFALHNRLMKL